MFTTPSPADPVSSTLPPYYLQPSEKRSITAYITTVRGNLGHHSMWGSTLTALAISLAVAALVLAVVVAVSRRQH